MIVRSKNYIAAPPGVTIKEVITNRGMTQKELAARLNCSEKHLSRLINGEVELTPEMAVKLEDVLGAPASVWNNLEAIYREKLVKADAENKLDADIEIAKKMPYNEMAENGWVPAAKSITEKALNLRKFFEVAELPLLDNRLITCIAFRRLSVTDKGDLAILAWTQEARIVARSIETAPINIQKLKLYLDEIRAMTREIPEKFCPKLKTMLSECGIALVFLPHLSGSYLQGASFYSGNKIVLGMTARGHDADKFWFSFFHEISHIILGHLGKPDGTTDDDEHAADRMAESILVPDDKIEQFKKNGCFTRKAIVTFSDDIGIDPGITVGRLQNDGVIKFNMFNDLKKHYVISMA